MRKTEKIEVMVLRDYYNAQDDETKKLIFEIITTAIGCSYSNFYYRLKNDSYSLSDKKVINHEFEINGINFRFDV